MKIRASATNAREDIIIYQNLAAIERADNEHRKLVNLVAQRIRNAGSLPRESKFIDLATAYNDRNFIFEMKSTTPKNLKSQIRAGLSQLYEYRYLQNSPNAELILVIEKPLSRKNEWIKDYLETDRDVSLVWDGDNNLFGSEKTRDKLHFLDIQ